VALGWVRQDRLGAPSSPPGPQPSDWPSNRGGALRQDSWHLSAQPPGSRLSGCLCLDRVFSFLSIPTGALALRASCFLSRET
jgi:hypothetical protein